VFRQKARREALLPLERVKEGDSAAAMKLWLPWARHWQARPAGPGNARNLPTAYRLVEELVMEGRDPAVLEARHGLPAGGAKGLLEEALLDYARRLQFFLNK
jgi:hypothetical protein